MSAFYKSVNWNRQKFIYDGLLALGVSLYLAVFVGVTFLVRPEATLETALIRGLGTAGLVLLHLILVIGPLARLDERFTPLLYNRRHLGVTMCLLALAHASFALIQFDGFGDVNPFVSLLAASADPASTSRFPFELLGLLALLILLLMAATSHDFWLANLSGPGWKRLHMLVYPAYALLVLHVALGTLQVESSPLPPALLGLGLITVVGLHLAAARRERRRDAQALPGDAEGFVEVCRVDEIREKRARMAVVGGERIALFRYDGKVSCVSSVCQHQNGPLAEGRIVDGCITCPWHGYQYQPDTGASPPPFTERIPTFAVQVRDGRVFVDPRPNPPGTRVEPARIAASPASVPEDREGFYVGYHPQAPPRYARFTQRATATVFGVILLLAAGLGASQDPFGTGLFEYGTLREFSGTLLEQPYPMLIVARPGITGRDAAYSRYLLVAQGKHGAQQLVAGHEGHHVRTSGTIVNREGTSMLEIFSADFENADAPAAGAPAPPISLGRRTIRGEILDSKCWLGVMKPAEGTVHRACATRCLSGGIPPLLIVRDSTIPSGQVLLLGAHGEPAHDKLKRYVGGVVGLTGEVLLEGKLVVMLVEQIDGKAMGS
jgi:nitrite reductase/ring-hydroxylating ferredoxin subunit/DMSO/TMAO reductase YedYZ heme-binding membrane subunit